MPASFHKMKRVFLPLLVAGGAAAQQITALPQLRNAAIAAAVNTNDPEYTICTNANSYLEFCINSLGGSSGLATAAPTALVGCVCCIEGTAISEAFSTCSSYLSAEEPSMSAEYSAYETLYSICGLTSCAAGSSRPSATGAASGTRGGDDDDDDETITSSIIPASGTISIPSSITATASLDDFPLECNSMLGLYESCSSKIDGFSAQPYRQQAECYCRLVWTDELDGYAQTCRDWAETGDPSTFFPLASTFATFCDNFSDVCHGPATAAPESTNSPSGDDDSNDSDDDSNAAGDDDRETVTVTQSTPQETDRPGVGSAVRAGCAAAFAGAMGAALLML
ncbi:hypothetical protein HJFPF1_09294 [Paramyrothecium foliicola]|nr:hypothetical protein HJFPF1_09294 [Paramyrothecium foliicola]